MAYKIITIYPSCSPESLIEAGQRAGMSEAAIDMFRHAEEYEVQVIVDDFGKVVRQGIATVPGGDILLPIADFDPEELERIVPQTSSLNAELAALANARQAEPSPTEDVDVDQAYQTVLEFLDSCDIASTGTGGDDVILALAAMIEMHRLKSYGMAPAAEAVKAGELLKAIGDGTTTTFRTSGEFAVEWIDQDHVRLTPVSEDRPAKPLTEVLADVEGPEVDFSRIGETDHKVSDTMRCQACGATLEPHEIKPFEDDVCDRCRGQEEILMGDKAEPATSAARLATGGMPISGIIEQPAARPVTCYDCDRIIERGELAYTGATDNALSLGDQRICESCYKHRRDTS